MAEQRERAAKINITARCSGCGRRMVACVPNFRRHACSARCAHKAWRRRQPNRIPIERTYIHRARPRSLLLERLPTAHLPGAASGMMRTGAAVPAGCGPRGLMACELLGCNASSRLLLEIHIGPAPAQWRRDDKAGVRFLDGPRRREAAGAHSI